MYIEHIKIEKICDYTDDTVIVFVKNNIIQFKDYFTTLQYKKTQTNEEINNIRWRKKIIYDSIDNYEKYNNLINRSYVYYQDDNYSTNSYSYICLYTDDKKIISKYRLCI